MDNLLQKIKDVGLTNFYDQPNDAGTYRWWTIGGLMEMYQGSNHQTQGLTCYDCHMNTVQKDDGTSFTSHMACGDINISEEKLTQCLDCHTSQGIKTTDGMRDLLNEKRAEKDKAVKAAAASLQQLYDLILAGVQNGDVDAASLDEARSVYADADCYYQYADGGMVTHDFAEIMVVAQKAKTTAENGIALFK